MKTVLGILLIVAGVIFGLWVGVWWAFIGGIIDIVNVIRATDLDAMNLAIGIAKVMFAGVAGTLSAYLGIIPGLALIASD
jgi:uncharacterized membrane protein